MTGCVAVLWLFFPCFYELKTEPQNVDFVLPSENIDGSFWCEVVYSEGQQLYQFLLLQKETSSCFA